MHIVIAKRKKSYQCVESDNGMTVVVDAAVHLPCPKMHVRIIGIKFGSVISNPGNNFKKMNGVFPENIKNNFAVVEVFINICGGPIGIIKSIDGPNS